MATGLNNLNIYKIAKALEESVYSLAGQFPKDEKFGKTSQLKRSSASVVDNIAESYGRHSFKEKIQFLILARGSAEEARSQLERAHLICNAQESIDSLVNDYTSEIKQINGFIKYLRSKIEKTI